MAGLSLSLLLVVGVLTWSARERAAEPEPTGADTSRSGQVAAALGDLERAVSSGDEKGAESLAPAGDAAAARLLRASVENASALRIRDVSLSLVDPVDPLPDGRPTTVAVETTWRLAGFDATPARARVDVEVVVDGDRVAVAGIGGSAGRVPLWLAGPLEVRRTPRTLVMVAGSAAAADRYARRARAAVPVVRSVVTSWRPRLVLEVPRSVDALERALGAPAGTYTDIAAVTATVDGSSRDDAPVHVFVNPVVSGGLRAVGAQVVVSHEATHVATGAATSAVPLWLLEGFADYVALREVPLPVTTTAAQITRQVRRSGPPRRLPDREDFAGTSTRLGATYESAWLACRVLADRSGGGPALLSLYEAVDGGEPLDQALQDSFGVTRAELTRLWRERLSDLAS